MHTKNIILKEKHKELDVLILNEVSKNELFQQGIIKFEINEPDSAEYLDIMSKFNTLSNSLNTFYRNLDIIEKRITKKRTLLEKLHNEENIIQV